ncbi:MAG TPA: UDP-N-acetylmuramoyl-tripeptide--D-alanyl-D-alanine ligase [Verrucomicrobia bacterium]|nr:UDP-N-acetylmuramoyl-tripeptide--D-alanyl-D-alanine ligase [Verrucomicrobiota bacterium]HOB32118.1 UDP-N-acetylmuramoyl-tripeptide--D-alanyl-D-alanine ligase [Verrucomicrobiota bacterium]HOP97246.1 UDP-N-acetylmuramoyl-tripeptide--D-alanyl-D-alanine ligase [Verrucomicrobiota bacterium]
MLERIAKACSGELVRGPGTLAINRICTDSRTVQPGDLFIALAGERFDAHAFLPDAVKKGAAAVIVDRSRPVPELPGCAVIAVNNTRAALGSIAAQYRRQFHLPIIAVGGSNGKTTTKELLASVLRQKFNTLSSEASFNNDVGVPLTLLRLERSHQVAVLEAGTNHPGELAPLIRMIRPRYGVITNIGREHLEFFETLAGVAREEGTLAELLPGDGKLFINGDGEWAGSIAKRSSAAVVRVGLDRGNDWRATDVRVDGAGVRFRVAAPRPDLGGEYQIRLLGRHQVTNALLALAVGAELGLDRAALERGLAECPPPAMRMQTWEFDGVRVLDDAYNANPDSMAAALQTLRDMPAAGRRIAVLGEMAELGAASETEHEAVGRCAAESGVDQLFAVGRMASVMARGARSAGLNRVLEFLEVEAAADAVRRFVKSGDVLLLKASRVSRLERVAELLKAGKGREGAGLA